MLKMKFAARDNHLERFIMCYEQLSQNKISYCKLFDKLIIHLKSEETF